MSVTVTAALSFVAVMVWLGHRKKEREAYYRSETMKKIAESGSAAAAIEYLRETERIAVARSRDTMRLMGPIFMAIGVGLASFMFAIAPVDQRGIAFIGLLPLLIGTVIVGYALFGMRKD